MCREETARSLTAGDVSKTKTKTTDRSRAQHREERRDQASRTVPTADITTDTTKKVWQQNRQQPLSHL